MNRILVFCLAGASFLSGNVPAVDGEPAAWLEGLSVDPRVSQEMGRFRSDDEPLEVSYVDQQARALRRAIADHFSEWLSKVRAQGCEPFTDVEYTRPGFLGTTPADHAAEDFEDGFQLIQAAACFPHLDSTPEEALVRYTAADFRMDVSSSIVGITPEGDRECVETRGDPLVMSPTRACNLIHRHVDNNIAVEHSQVVSNGDPAEYSTVYFKESLKAFVELDGTLAFYYVNYTRASRLGRFKKTLARRAISGSLSGALEALDKALNETTSESSG